MGDQVDRLFQEWHRLGGAVLLVKVDHSVPARGPEEVIGESTAHCRESGRLTWVVLDWLIHHVEQIDETELLRQTRKRGDLSVLGVLCDAARLRNPHPKFERIMAACVPRDKVELFFDRVAGSPLATRLTRENALDVFRRWNYLCNELRYLRNGEGVSGFV
ncbi:MAG: hypothetical protein ACE5LU_07585 [Anaerolineae bacterium]